MHDIFNLCATGVSIHVWLVGWFMVFNATFNIISIISRQSILLVEETGVPTDLSHVTDKMVKHVCIIITSSIKESR